MTNVVIGCGSVMQIKQYIDIIQGQLNKGVVEVADDEPSDEKCFEVGMTDLPHREVTSDDK